MIDTESLRKKVIDLAIQGKLTEQLLSDGNAETLYSKIQNDRLQQIKEGKIKKEKALQDISSDEKPFEIPQNWKWVRLGEVASIYGGKRIPAGRKLTTENTGYKYIRVSDMKNRTVITDNLLYVPDDIYPSISRYIINKEDVYITVAGTIGKVGKIPEEIDGVNLTENADRIVFNFLSQDWLIWCLSASVVQWQIEQLTTQVAQPKLAIKRIQEFVLPLPPYEEQNRIARIIDEAYQQMDIIDDLQEKYSNNLSTLKSKIIDAGIQGKLTEQSENDKDVEELFVSIQEEKKQLIKEKKIKKEKSLPIITDEEIPFEIPQNWKWVRLRDICRKIVDGDHNPPAGVSNKTDYLMLSAQNVNEDKLVNIEQARYLSEEVFVEENKRTQLEKGDVLLTIVATLGRSCVYRYDYNVCFQRSVCVISTFINPDYLKRVLDS